MSNCTPGRLVNSNQKTFVFASAQLSRQSNQTYSSTAFRFSHLENQIAENHSSRRFAEHATTQAAARSSAPPKASAAATATNLARPKRIRRGKSRRRQRASPSRRIEPTTAIDEA